MAGESGEATGGEVVQTTRGEGWEEEEEEAVAVCLIVALIQQLQVLTSDPCTPFASDQLRDASIPSRLPLPLPQGLAYTAAEALSWLLAGPEGERVAREVSRLPTELRSTLAQAWGGRQQSGHTVKANNPAQIMGNSKRADMLRGKGKTRASWKVRRSRTNVHFGLVRHLTASLYLSLHRKEWLSMRQLRWRDIYSYRGRLRLGGQRKSPSSPKSLPKPSPEAQLSAVLRSLGYRPLPPESTHSLLPLFPSSEPISPLQPLRGGSGASRSESIGRSPWTRSKNASDVFGKSHHRWGLVAIPEAGLALLLAGPKDFSRNFSAPSTKPRAAEEASVVVHVQKKDYFSGVAQPMGPLLMTIELVQVRME